MNTWVHKICAGILLALLLAVGVDATFSQAPVSAAAPSRGATPPARSHDEALLREVRLIRETLERAQGAAQREQILVERMRTHDQRVERLDQQLTELRDEMGGIEVHLRQANERQKSLEQQIPRAGDPAQRQAREAELKEMQFMQEAQRQRLNRLGERESALTAALQKEERTLRGLELRLEALDRELETQARKNGGTGRP